MISLPRLALAMLATATLSAADFTGGLQVGPGFPGSDFKTFTDTSTTPYGFLFGRWDFGNGQALRVKLDYASASGNFTGSLDIEGNALVVALNTKATTLGLTADYLYYPQGTTAQGLYFGGGLGVASNVGKVTLPPVTVNGAPVIIDGETVSGSEQKTATSGVGDVFVGYQFNHNWNVELGYRYTAINETDDGIKLNWELPMVVLTAGYTF